MRSTTALVRLLSSSDTTNLIPVICVRAGRLPNRAPRTRRCRVWPAVRVTRPSASSRSPQPTCSRGRSTTPSIASPWIRPPSATTNMRSRAPSGTCRTPTSTAASAPSASARRLSATRPASRECLNSSQIFCIKRVHSLRIN